MTNELARLVQAAHFAADKHRRQKRKNREASPYINHPLAVAHLLSSVGGVTDANLLIAAVLHDTVEDTDATLDEVREQFGADVAQLVEEVTDDKSLPKQRRKELQIEHAPQLSDRAKQLKLADKTSNVRDIDADSPADWSHDRKVEYLDWAVRVVAGCRGTNQQLEQQFDQVLERVRARIPSRS